ncbi:hypothetical protein HF324_27775 [Chitinophaga oryzae]|uniref:Uncharacterized protein n=1 Tax=Chitinophaga oryzae TaxID=2725414 RepID=A0AAE6ZP11_9BACT|nr:hypothetical protein [Chitinophaga oryzae]QJB34925.1 hypothetical protein HF329_27915 [Chitinophaga oryzae]QJB41436.1 hypothetical protein HF324_27775 [Chitinophaga oryzae]
MKTKNPEELVAYLKELWLDNSMLETQLPKLKEAPQADVHGQYFPTDTEMIRFNYSLHNLGEGKGIEISSYTMQVHSFSEITHVKAGHINTADVEDVLRLIPWNQEAITHNPGVKVLLQRFMEMRENETARPVIDELLGRYWKNTQMEQAVSFPITSNAVVKEMSFPITGQITDIDLQEGFNLIQGRAVLKPVLDEMGIVLSPLQSQWLMEEGGALAAYPDFDFRRCFYDLPATVRPVLKRDYMEKAISGHLIPAHMENKGENMPGFLWIDPRIAGLRFTDLKGTAFDVPKPVAKKQQSTVKAPPIKSKAKVDKKKTTGIKR